MSALSRWFGALLDALMLLAAVLVLIMTLMIGADVILRNAGAGGVSWSNEVSEYILYLVTLLSAPWLLRRGQHIRVDIVLRAVPKRIAYAMEWIADVLGLACALYFVWYGWRVMAASYAAGAISMKTLVLPEWWIAAMPRHSCWLPPNSCFACIASPADAGRATKRVGRLAPGSSTDGDVLADGGTAAARRIDGAAVPRHAGGPVVRGHQHRRGRAVPGR
jgi:TRAP-type C4-dicarboxylate transport system permease small subunit